MTSYCYYPSPLGPLLLVSATTALTQINFPSPGHPTQAKPEWQKDEQPLREVIRQLQAYFAGELESFDVELAPNGTPFQQRVWKELLKIPYGETISYGELARRVGNPNASRAVGLANGSNPIPIIIPCHRVIGSNGKLTGYGGGLPIKERLLALEKRQLRLL
ncbi:MAG TPA: methylated-DNA--[protein]-cysteine S-methyltransferase [Terriglobales bacterium]|nr:methylated-DNA--[protein]-cysteine S-methyltransferase [Terriglobales bacterium]